MIRYGKILFLKRISNKIKNKLHKNTMPKLSILKGVIVWQIDQSKSSKILETDESRIKYWKEASWSKWRSSQNLELEKTQPMKELVTSQEKKWKWPKIKTSHWLNLLMLHSHCLLCLSVNQLQKLISPILVGWVLN